MFSVDDYRWLMAPSGREAWRQVLTASGSPTLGEMKSIAHCTEMQARLLIEQLEFARGKAKKKFSDPSRWFWVGKLLEQASDEATANETALDFPADADVVDGCCGAGADAVALSARGCRVFAIDKDPIACALTQANLSSHALKASVQCSDVTDLIFPPEYYVNLDPDRRLDGSRTIEPQHMTPPWESIAPLLVRSRGASLKLAPGFRYRDDFPWHPASTPHAIRWLSSQGSVRQQRWYWNVDRWPANARIASMQVRNGDWHHEVFATGGEQTLDELTGIRFRAPIGEFVADQDPVVRAAEIHLALAHRLNLNLIGVGAGYYHAESCVMHPMLQWFRVLEIVSMDEKKVRAVARSLSPRTWELKSRGVEVNMERMQRTLHTDSNSPRALTILFTRQDKKHMALFTERVKQEESNVEAT